MSKNLSKEELLKQKEEEKRKAEEEAKKEILDSYLEIVDQKKFHPTRADLLLAGHSNDKIRRYFGNLQLLRAEAKKFAPKLFKGIIDESDIGEEAKEKLAEKISKYKRFVVTSAVNGCFVHPGFLRSLENYCELHNALLLILPSHDPAHNLDNRCEWHFDSMISNYDIVFHEMSLNSNVFLSSIKIGAKQINPTTGLGRIGQKDGSFIFASPKQSLEYVPVSPTKYPHALMSTGAVTVPNYKTTRFLSNRTAYIADYDHVLGALIVEVEDDQIYHFRQLQADSEGAFCDLGKLYKGKKVTNMRPDVIFGDYHAGEEDPTVVKVWKEIAEFTNARDGYFHDLFNGKSISHHEQHKLMTLAIKAQENKITLSEELKEVARALNDIEPYLEHRYIVKSNHDEWIERYLEDGRFMKEPQNTKLALKLASAMLDGEDPLKVGVETVAELKNAKSITWLERDEERKVGGVECGAHGDVGPNGSPGTKNNLERSYVRANVGHLHTPGILRGLFIVGTTTRRKLSWTKGNSSWMNTLCLQYPNGSRQLINCIQGKWKLGK